MNNNTPFVAFGKNSDFDYLIHRIRLMMIYDHDKDTMVKTLTSEGISMEKIFLCYHAAKIMDNI